MPARLTFDEAWDLDPIWSPDSRTIYFRSNRSGRFDLYRTPADSTSSEERLSEDDIDKQPTGVSPDGKSLFYATRGNESRSDIWALPLQPRAAPLPLLQNPYPENGGVASPDGKWMAYIANDQGRVDVYATLLSGRASRQQISLGGGGMPIRWRRDGKELFRVGPDDSRRPTRTPGIWQHRMGPPVQSGRPNLWPGVLQIRCDSDCQKPAQWRSRRANASPSQSGTSMRGSSSASVCDFTRPTSVVHARWKPASRKMRRVIRS